MKRRMLDTPKALLFGLALFYGISLSSRVLAFEKNISETEMAVFLGQTQFSQLVVGDEAIASIGNMCWQEQSLMLDTASTVAVSDKTIPYLPDFQIQIERVPGKAFRGRTLVLEESSTGTKTDTGIRSGGLAQNLLMVQTCDDRAKRYSGLELLPIKSIDGFDNLADLMKAIIAKGEEKKP